MCTFDGAFATTPGDPDGPADLAHYLWVFDRGTSLELVFSGVAANIPLTIGAHQLELFVTDRAGATAYATQPVVVRDVEGPIIEAIRVNPECVWPPNHMMASYRLGHELGVVARDRCSPGSETVEVVSVTSSQADDGRGDGATTNDAVITNQGFCVRAERSGADPRGREYEVIVRARDGTGNASRTATIVRVAHDQRPSNRCLTTSSAMLSDDDPACQPISTPTLEEPRPPQPLPASNGCSSVPVSAVFVGFALLTRRAIRRRP